MNTSTRRFFCKPKKHSEVFGICNYNPKALVLLLGDVFKEVALLLRKKLIQGVAVFVIVSKSIVYGHNIMENKIIKLETLNTEGII